MNKDNPIFDNEKKYLLNTYKRIPIEISHGEGVYLYSKDRKKYLDFFAGLAVNALGYSHPAIQEAINEQASKYIHLSNYYISDPQIKLAELLIKISGMSKVFFTNSGTEAVEASIKLIRKFYGPEKQIISLSDSFHGRTYGSLSLTGREAYRKNFEPLLQNILQIKHNNINELENEINKNTAAVFLEFIQGEGGINIISDEFDEKLNELKTKFNFAIVADEIQSGLGRTGKAFGFNHFKTKPDLIVIAKALGGGLPLGALLTIEKYSEVFKPGDHGSTFGGNPVACSAGTALLNEIFESGLLEQVSRLGNYLVNELNILKNNFPSLIKDVRGFGFMIGIEMAYDCANIVSLMREKNVLINCTNTNVVRLLPPLITEKEQIDYFLYNFNEVLKELK